jgi:hypothetical protein
VYNQGETMNDYITVSIDITLKDKDMSGSEIFKHIYQYGVKFTGRDATGIFKFCLGVLLEQDAYSKEEIKEATRIISELTNDGFTINSKEA